MVRILIFIIAAISSLFAQDNNNPSINIPDAKDGQYFSKAPSEKIRNNLYLGIGSGLNNYVGILGTNFELRLGKSNFTAYAGAGLGSWGYKLSGGFRYYFNIQQDLL